MKSTYSFEMLKQIMKDVTKADILSYNRFGGICVTKKTILLDDEVSCKVHYNLIEPIICFDLDEDRYIDIDLRAVLNIILLNHYYLYLYDIISREELLRIHLICRYIKSLTFVRLIK